MSESLFFVFSVYGNSGRFTFGICNIHVAQYLEWLITHGENTDQFGLQQAIIGRSGGNSAKPVRKGFDFE